MGGGTVWAEGLRGRCVEAIERGSAQVIVHIRVAAMSDGPAEWAERHQRAIVQAREALLRALPSTSYRVTRVYDTIPFIALEVSGEALRVLKQSSLVRGIEEDALSAPQEVLDTGRPTGGLPCPPR